MHSLHLFRAYTPLEPEKLALASEVVKQPLLVEFREYPRQLRCGVRRIDHMRRLRIKGVGFKIRGQYIAMSVDDIRARRVDFRACSVHARLLWLRGGQHTHPQTDDYKGNDKEHPQYKQPAFGTLSGLIAHLFMTNANIFALDHIWVFPFTTRIQNTRQRAQRRADHGRPSSDASRFATSITSSSV